MKPRSRDSRISSLNVVCGSNIRQVRSALSMPQARPGLQGLTAEQEIPKRQIQWKDRLHLVSTRSPRYEALDCVGHTPGIPTRLAVLKAKIQEQLWHVLCAMGIHWPAITQRLPECYNWKQPTVKTCNGQEHNKSVKVGITPQYCSDFLMTTLWLLVLLYSFSNRAEFWNSELKHDQHRFCKWDKTWVEVEEQQVVLKFRIKKAMAWGHVILKPVWTAWVISFLFDRSTSGRN